MASFDLLKVVECALGDKYTLVLTSEAKVYLIGVFPSIRNSKKSSQMDLINPINLTPKGARFAKIRSGLNHALAVEFSGKLYNLSENKDKEPSK